MGWLIHTCLLGLLPAMARMLVWYIYKGDIDPLSASDFVAFGLVLHSANVNEVNRVAGSDEVWRSVHNGLSVMFIVVYALLMFATLIPSETINLDGALKISLILSAVSFILSTTVFFRARAEGGS